jgi:GAF domain-containing protein
VIDISNNRAGLAFREGVPGVSNDFFGNPFGITAAFEDRARRNGVQAAAWIPVLAGGRVDGVLTVLSAKRDHFDSRRVEVLGAYAAAIAVLLEADRATNRERVGASRSGRGAKGPETGCHQWPGR